MFGQVRHGYITLFQFVSLGQIMPG